MIKIMSGFTLEFAILIISLAIKRLLLFIILGVINSIAFAKVFSPTEIYLGDGRLVQQDGNLLFTVDAKKRKILPIKVPLALKQALKTSSSIAFPSDHSRLIDGKEYILVVVNQPSSSNPTGYCGAGEEGMLYALELHESTAVPHFSLPVQSCLKDMDLASDSNQKSGYLAITWQETPIGIQVRWDIYGNESDVSRFYKYQDGRFVEVNK